MTKPLLLLLPGLLCDEASWNAQIDALQSTRCVVPTYGRCASIADMARAVLSTLPAQRFAVAGHSMGGRVALEIMRQAPDRVERIALLDSGIGALDGGEAGKRERAQRMAWLRLAQEHGMRALGRDWARGMVHPAHLDAAVFEQILAMIERKTPEVFEAQIEALLARPDASDTWRGIACPTLLLCGRQDAWSPLSRHAQMHAMLPSAQLVVIEDAGHFAMMEQPAAVSRALADWLRR